MNQRATFPSGARAVAGQPLHADEREIEAAIDETRAVLADLAFAHRAAHERLDAWDGPDDEKRLIADDLDRRSAAARLAYEERRAELEARREALDVTVYMTG